MPSGRVKFNSASPAVPNPGTERTLLMRATIEPAPGAPRRSAAMPSEEFSCRRSL